MKILLKQANWTRRSDLTKCSMESDEEESESPQVPWGTVPELLFEKKQLIPALQQLLVSYSRFVG